MALHLQELLRDRNVGSIAATTQSSARKICARVPFPLSRIILEYGPGDGALTRILLQRMRSDALLIVIEQNERFVRELRHKLIDPRLLIVQGSAENVKGILRGFNLANVDCVISGVPFSFLSRQAIRRILGDTRRLLNPSGRFLIYQSLTAPLQRRATKRLVAHGFRIAREQFLYFNFPPLYLIEAVPRSTERTPTID